MSKALMVFAKRPMAGRVKTRLTPPLSPGDAAELYRRMLLDILATCARMAGVALLLFYEPGEGNGHFFAETAPGWACRAQEGDDLGARLDSAFQVAFDEGYGEVAVIGTDSPDLPEEYVRLAFELLGRPTVDAVYGPSEDGGYYLLALKRYLPELFRHIPWSTGKVLEQSLARAEAAGVRVELLPVWYDVDTAADLRRPGLAGAGATAPLTAEFVSGLISAHPPDTQPPAGER
ncbi:TIGR04282 family arsenosugar biosynthesis glycosyltransferase [Geobacter anodireducens]